MKYIVTIRVCEYNEVDNGMNEMGVCDFTDVLLTLPEYDDPSNISEYIAEMLREESEPDCQFD